MVHLTLRPDYATIHPDKRMIAMVAATPAILNHAHTLAEPTRCRMLRLLERAELTVAELCDVVQLPQSTVSRHLKVLADAGWVDHRPQGPARLYRMTANDADSPESKLWALLRDQTAATVSAQQDDRRLPEVLARRRQRSREFFRSGAGQWDAMRQELFGGRFDLLALPALLDGSWVVGDLGCGTGQIVAAVAPFVKHVIGVDESAKMVKAGRNRLADAKNITFKRGDLHALPLEDGELDAAILSLVLHHLPDYLAAVAEAARVLKPGGKLLIVDMLEHDRQDFRQQMGHAHLGFDETTITTTLKRTGFDAIRFTPLPSEPAAKGPGLFATTGIKNA